MTVMAASRVNLRPNPAHRERYARLVPKSKILHKRREIERDCDPSEHYTMCGRYIDLGHEATPLCLRDDDQLCKICVAATY